MCINVNTFLCFGDTWEWILLLSGSVKNSENTGLSVNCLLHKNLLEKEVVIQAVIGKNISVNKSRL